MRTKTQYKSEGENNPAVEAVIAPAPDGPAVAVEVRPQPETQPESDAERKHTEETTKADEAAEALRKQIDELRKNEELQRRQQQQVNETNQQINQVFGFWKQSGLSPDQEQILRANPALMIQLTDFAAREATGQGHQLGSPEHTEAAKRSFFGTLADLQQQARQPAATADNQHIAEAEPMPETPPFFKAPEPKPVRPQSVPVSAPVSRTVPTGGPRPEFEQNPSRVVLSAEEKEIARASKISEVEYARGKILLQRRKAAGEL